MYYLAGGGPGHRLKVLIDWISARLGEPQDQVIDGELASIERPSPSPSAASTKTEGKASRGRVERIAGPLVMIAS